MWQEEVRVAVSSEPQRAGLHMPEQLHRQQRHMCGEAKPHPVTIL